MPSREVIVRETLITDNLTYTAADDRETKRMVRTIRLEGDERLQVEGTSTFTITATRAEAGMSADQWHTLIAAARVVLLELEKAGKPTPEGTLSANLVQRGFTAEVIRDAVNLLRAEKVVARRDGAIHDLTGTDHRATRRLSPESLAPRNTAAPAPSSSTTAVRPNMPVDERMIQSPEQLDMAARMRAQAESMPTASFEVGDVPAAKPAPKKDEKTPVAIPDSAIVTYIDAITSAFARYGKPSATWKDLGVRLPSTELPEGVTRQTTAAAALDKLAASGTIRHESGVYTHVPAERAVAGLTKWIGESAKAGALITPAAARALAQREDVQKLAPNGWNAETLVALALDAVVTSGAIERVDGGWMKPAPKVVEKPVAPARAPKPAETDPKPETPQPEGTTPVASASGQTPEGNKTEKSETPPAVSIPVLEKKVDVLTVAVGRVEQKLHTLPAPPTKEREMYTDATPEARHVLEKVLVQLKLKSAAPDESDRYMNREALKLRVPGRARVTATNPNPPDLRQHLDAALELGRAMGVISYTEKRGYLFVTHVNVMPKGELDRRVQRVLDIRASREKKKSAA